MSVLRAISCVGVRDIHSSMSVQVPASEQYPVYSCSLVRSAMQALPAGLGRPAAAMLSPRIEPAAKLGPVLQ